MSDLIDERYDSYIDGEWVPSKKTFEVRDPATGDLLTEVAEAGQHGIDRALSVAETTLSDWQEVPPDEREQILRDVGDLIRKHVDRLAQIETLEMGRPLEESKALIIDAARYFEYYGGMVDKIQGETIPVPGNYLDYTLREPKGISAQIIPWNASMLLGARGIAPALACGNTVVAKPSPEAPISLLEFAELATGADLPSGVLNIVPGGSNTGSALTSNPRIDCLTFTGSRETGTKVMQAAAENIVPVGLELGGNNPAIAFADADPAEVATDMRAAYYNTSQVCFAPTRLFIHEDIYDETLSELVDRVKPMTVGHGLEGADMGPLISTEAQQTVADYVDQAVEDGAILVTGGRIPQEKGNFYEPTIVEDVADDAPLSCDEVFGPVIVVYEFSEEDEVIERANNVDYGLYAVIYTDTLNLGHRVAHELKVGSVVINEYPATFPQAPFGGYKDSGISREKGFQAIEHYTEVKNVTVSLDDGSSAAFKR